MDVMPSRHQQDTCNGNSNSFCLYPEHIFVKCNFGLCDAKPKSAQQHLANKPVKFTIEGQSVDQATGFSTDIELRPKNLKLVLHVPVLASSDKNNCNTCL